MFKSLHINYFILKYRHTFQWLYKGWQNPFTKVSAANVLLKLNYLQSRVKTIQKYHIYHIKQYQTFYRKFKCDLLNFREVKNGYHQDFQHLMVSNHFFVKWQRWYKVLCLINCNYEKKNSSIFLMERPYYTFKDETWCLD